VANVATICTGTTPGNGLDGGIISVFAGGATAVATGQIHGAPLGPPPPLLPPPPPPLPAPLPPPPPPNVAPVGPPSQEILDQMFPIPSAPLARTPIAPPAPLVPGAAGPQGIPVVPEADSLLLLTVGLAAVGGLLVARRGRRRADDGS
jgi:hypothetical protein